MDLTPITAPKAVQAVPRDSAAAKTLAAGKSAKSATSFAAIYQKGSGQRDGTAPRQHDAQPDKPGPDKAGPDKAGADKAGAVNPTDNKPTLDNTTAGKATADTPDLHATAEITVDRAKPVRPAQAEDGDVLHQRFAATRAEASAHSQRHETADPTRTTDMRTDMARRIHPAARDQSPLAAPIDGMPQMSRSAWASARTERPLTTTDQAARPFAQMAEPTKTLPHAVPAQTATPGATGFEPARTTIAQTTVGAQAVQPRTAMPKGANPADPAAALPGSAATATAQNAGVPRISHGVPSGALGPVPASGPSALPPTTRPLGRAPVPPAPVPPAPVPPVHGGSQSGQFPEMTLHTPATLGLAVNTSVAMVNTRRIPGLAVDIPSPAIATRESLPRSGRSNTEWRQAGPAMPQSHTAETANIRFSGAASGRPAPHAVQGGTPVATQSASALAASATGAPQGAAVASVIPQTPQAQPARTEVLQVRQLRGSDIHTLGQRGARTGDQTPQDARISATSGSASGATPGATVPDPIRTLQMPVNTQAAPVAAQPVSLATTLAAITPVARENPESRGSERRSDRVDAASSTFATTRTAPKPAPQTTTAPLTAAPPPRQEAEAKPLIQEAELTALSDTSRSAATQTSLAPAPLPLAQRPDLPQMIARQLAENAARAGDRPVELTLNPDELGRVRMQLTTAETGIMVHINAERPETLDLMRRHIDQLARDFAAMGFADIGFEFGYNAPRDDTPSDGSQMHGTLDEPAEPELPDAPVLTDAQGLDIKL